MSDLTQADFTSPEKYQWTAHHANGYTYVIRQVDGAYEVIIRPEIHQDPTSTNWKDALEVCNFHVKHLRIARNSDVDYKESNE